MLESFNDKLIITGVELAQPVNAQALSCFSLPEIGKTFLLYKTGKIDNGYEIVSASEMQNGILYNINEDEWLKVKETMKKIISGVEIKTESFSNNLRTAGEVYGNDVGLTTEMVQKLSAHLAKTFVPIPQIPTPVQEIEKPSEPIIEVPTISIPIVEPTLASPSIVPSVFAANSSSLLARVFDSIDNLFQEEIKIRTEQLEAKLAAKDKEIVALTSEIIALKTAAVNVAPQPVESPPAPPTA